MFAVLFLLPMFYLDGAHLKKSYDNKALAISKDLKLQEECQKFWNLDPYKLESLCAYQALYHDDYSSQRIRQLFPQVKKNEVPLFATTILALGKTDHNFSKEEILLIQKVSCPGLSLASFRESMEIDPEKDLARALVLLEFPGDLGKSRANYYSNCLDILALRIHAERQRYLDASPCVPGTPKFHKATIEAINTILFYEEAVRYPSKKEMFSDEFSFLSSVTDRKFGVCLGVSSLYFSLSQRLDLPLEVVTPPGHIYLRYRGGEVNIETTAGGRHLSTESYCDCLALEDLQVRTPKEMIGLTFMNQGSFALQKKKYKEAEEAYKKAQEYLQDAELQELLGFVQILGGKEKEGRSLIKNSHRATQKGSVAYDYLKGRINMPTLALLFCYPGSNYEEVASYGEELKKAMKSSMVCCEGQRRLASVALHLGKMAEGVSLLEVCAEDIPDDFSLHLRLCKILCDRHDYRKALKYFLIAERLMEDQGFFEKDSRSFALFYEVKKIMSIVAPQKASILPSIRSKK
nr:transglutaminase family protein [Candidatus Chlamydia corallus]